VTDFDTLGAVVSPLRASQSIFSTNWFWLTAADQRVRWKPHFENQALPRRSAYGHDREFTQLARSRHSRARNASFGVTGHEVEPTSLDGVQRVTKSR